VSEGAKASGGVSASEGVKASEGVNAPSCTNGSASAAAGAVDPLLPPAPKRKPSTALAEKVRRFIALRAAGRSVNQSLANRVAFSNPSILTHLVQHHRLNELGTNYPRLLFNSERFEERFAVCGVCGVLRVERVEL
jgi:HCNGP-like protein